MALFRKTAFLVVVVVAAGERLLWRPPVCRITFFFGLDISWAAP